MRCSKCFANCTAGDSTTEPYVVTHHLILAHVAVVKVYREKFQASQKGQIGVTLNSAWVVPLVQSKEDREAAYRGLAFMYDCLYGQYGSFLILGCLPFLWMHLL
ncbi:beta-glucosidase 13-like [Glycine soja]|uniref:beta-glucosidase 13-like n=1 Tax=Glycine soja TaxID=3848 RepID=UPI00103AD4D6|nr:beta-glucosidase 13-like [Glycine soja]